MQLEFVLILFIWLYFSIFCHEMGHFLTAKIVGFNPYLVKIGMGKKILQFKLFSSVIEFGSIPGGGITYISNLELKWLKSKLILMYLGGPIVNFILFFALTKLSNYYDGEILVDVSFVEIINFLAYIEILLFIFNILPLEAKQYGMNVGSDGKQVIDALTKSNQQFIQKLLGLSRYTSKQDNSSNQFFNNDLKSLQLLFKAQAQINRQNFDDAVELLELLLNNSHFITRDKIYIIDILASIVINHGENKYLQKADKWSGEALLLANDIKTVQGTRGSILIELGRYNEGKEMLLPLTEAGNDTIDIVVSCCYIAKADYFLGNEEQAKNWLKKAKKVGAGSPTLHQIISRIQREINCFV
ncbi:M50 family metallopeptidase [Chlorogloeopsis sp. ULAP01]|uniref:M50 family metallopeptidase n=1 Tax=Chlorogloeopsis sp. ULAP01 TaxID=3056483 RepID=UPI0025AAC41D|nr:M50 family metallopeptidase [Chlorogloeopsis sp. ULAP01]MDM9384339.1 M50 family metallopeptidase [Chlorogloeopsis sp. ULAP01]